MRWVICALTVLTLAPAAYAADLDLAPLRSSQSVGPPTYTNWSGFYIGGQATYISGGADFANATQSLIAFILRDTFIESQFGVSRLAPLGKVDTNGTGFGGFLGYNTQWEGAVLGVEANYTKTNWMASATPGTIARHFDSGGTRFDVALDASSSLKLIDYTSLRGRAGWVMSRFMPYGFASFVVGRADITKSVTVTELETNISTGAITGALGPTTNAESQSGKFIYGYSGGLGLDVALSRNIFVRGEYEFVQFVGLGGMKLNTNNGRVGAGFRF